MSARRSPQLVPVTLRGGVGSRCLPARAVVRCNRHEARARIVALMSCCLVRLSNGGLGPPDETASSLVASVHAAEVFVVVPLWRARLDQLAFSGDKRGRSKALFFAVPNGTSITGPEPVIFSRDLENWAYEKSTSETTAKDIISTRTSFLARDAMCTVTRLAS